jgi:AraC-like DNA-binding protein
METAMMKPKQIDMETAMTKPKQDIVAAALNNKVLMLNGYSAIQSCTAISGQDGSMFLDENMLLIILEGTLKIRYGKAEYEVKKNQMAFLKKDILVYYETASDPEHSVKVEYILFSLKFELVKEFVKLAELSIAAKEEVLPITINHLDKRLLKYIDSLEFYFIEPEKVEGSLIKIKLLELLFYLSANDNKILEQLLDLREHCRSNITATVEENIMNSLSLNQLAVLSGRSLSSFRRDFLAIYNMPPSQWIRQKRIEKARELLISTKMTITNICYTTGFENIAHFSRLFKSEFGYCPTEFRMKLNIVVE